MKNLKESLIKEAKQIEYSASLINTEDKEGLPISVSILVDKEHQKNFEAWAEELEGVIFSHMGGGNLEY